MMASSDEHRRLLAVVDDWKANHEAGSPAYFVARIFDCQYSAFPCVQGLLRSGGASKWHASGDRANHKFLFNFPDFDSILPLLSGGCSVLVDDLANTEDFQTHEVDQAWTTLRGNSEVARRWPKNNAQARALFRFIDHLGRCIQSALSPRAGSVESLESARGRQGGANVASACYVGGHDEVVSVSRLRVLTATLLLLTACSSSEASLESPANVASESDGLPEKEAKKGPEISEEARRKAVAGLPEGPCKEAVPCEEVQVLMDPYFVWKGRKVCFWEQDARCACAEQLGVDDRDFCSGYY